ncbi:MAG TPA: fused MFS/spermidine synthase [Bryobacteraceae bacterium]|nr:fused MFS/spermidine synthase [Bryobacteraceae bacterium]
MFAYACTIFLSAFLLFAVQPMIGKIILPWFGGSAAVWSTCLMFFQSALLAGYLYAHWSTTSLKPKKQAMLHIGLLAVSLALLPILPSPSWKPSHPGDPSLRILLLLAATIGLPYILLSTTSPLLQAWYVAAKPGAIPYRLFALSNFGSLLALLSYPVLVEPVFTTHSQAYGWSGIYVIFGLVCAVVAWVALRSSPTQPPALARPAPSQTPPPTWKIRVLWAALAACSSVLLLAITNHLSQNVAPIPFLWVLPLGAYLLSFILCFERDKVYHRGVFLPLLIIALDGAAYATYANEGNPNIAWAIPTFVAALFIGCMVCHGELVRLKPDPRHLTGFYLMISLGGAIGGVFVAIIAPHVFHTYLELPLSMVACAALAAGVLWIAPEKWKGKIPVTAVRIGMAAFTVGLAIHLGYEKHVSDQRFRQSERNFYGVLRVRDIPQSEEETAVRRLIHGTINHGEQLLDPARRDQPTSYYGPYSGLGRALGYLQKREPVRVAVIGLGAGVTASYCRPGDFFRFYEINPLALSIASTWFTFLHDCKADHAVLLGDARLTLEAQPSQHFDLMAIDAFSSDAIPVHLLTHEAFALYFRHLKPAGILAVHVSNRYLDLVPVVSRNARAFGKTAIDVDDQDEEEDYFSDSDWVLVSADAAIFRDSAFKSSSVTPARYRPNLRPWTDDYSNLFQILKIRDP